MTTADLPPPLEYRMYTRDELLAYAKLAVRQALERIMELINQIADDHAFSDDYRGALRAEVERLVQERDNLDYKTAYEELEQQFVAMKERAEAAEAEAERLLKAIKESK